MARFGRPNGDQRQIDRLTREAREEARRSLEGDVVIADERRLILRSPNGHFWSIAVNDAGSLSAVDLGDSPL